MSNFSLVLCDACEERPATMTLDDGSQRCDRCNERAYDRIVEDFYGSSSPQTDAERYDQAAAEKRQLERC
jgi:hypothetical protein